MKSKHDSIEFNKDCSIRKAIEIIGMKNSILIFNELLKHNVLRFGQLRKVLGDLNTRTLTTNLKELLKHKVLRFGQLRKVLGNLNTGTLTTTLKQLEESGLIDRKVYGEIPPRVEYSLTNKGKELKDVLLQLQIWYEKWYKK